MSFLRKIFGGGDPLQRLRRTLEERRWADALAFGRGIDRSVLGPDACAELDTLLAAAGDGLARLNLTEGEACQRAGDASRAAEHFALAAEQACSADLRQHALNAADGMRPAVSPAPQASAAPGCSSHVGCTTSCGEQPATSPENKTDGHAFDPHTRLELLLSSYPEAWAARYLALQGPLLEAFLLAHEERGDEALAAFQAAPEETRDDLFYFERGALRARLGHIPDATADLEKAIKLNPDHLLAMEALVQLEMATGNLAAAGSRLEQMLARRLAPGFCHAMLAQIGARRGEGDKAVEHGLQALAAGHADTETLLLVAHLLEQGGRQGDAERVLMQLPGGGCSGGPALPLAEFWLRHGKNLDKALEAFKGALRQEPSNPRWLLRVAEVYLARGWKKEGEHILCKLLADADLDPELSARARSLHDSLPRL